MSIYRELEDIADQLRSLASNLRNATRDPDQVASRMRSLSDDIDDLARKVKRLAQDQRQAR